MDAEHWDEPWIARVRDRCPLLELGFHLDAAPLSDSGADDSEVVADEELLADDFAEISDPYQVLKEELDRAGDVAVRFLHWLSAQHLIDVGPLVPSEARGLEFLHHVNRTHGPDLAALLAEAGHKLPLACPYPLNLDDYLAEVFPPSENAEEPLLRQLPDYVRQLLTHVERDVA